MKQHVTRVSEEAYLFLSFETGQLNIEAYKALMDSKSAVSVQDRSCEHVYKLRLVL